MSNIDRCVQLHEVLEVHYYVTVWEVQLYTQDGNRLVMTADGSSVLSAMDHLNMKLHGHTLETIRKLPAISGMKADKAIREL